MQTLLLVSVDCMCEGCTHSQMSCLDSASSFFNVQTENIEPFWPMINSLRHLCLVSPLRGVPPISWWMSSSSWPHPQQVSGRERYLLPHSCVAEVNNQPSRFHSFYVHQLNVCFICPKTLIRENEIMLIIWHQSNKQALAGSYRDLDTPTCTHAVGGYDYTWITAFIVCSIE